MRLTLESIMSLPFDVTTQEYVKVIFSLEQENRVARVTDIAQRRGVTKSSVSLVLQQLQKKELIDRKQYGHITLTRSGRRLGNTLTRRFEIIRTFLVEVMGVSAKIAADDACRLEHVVSNETWNSLRHFVDVLQHCPTEMRQVLNDVKNCTVEGNLEQCTECSAASVNNEKTE
jgi:DtxR family transcriptional regulator, Mn-dependent transcriptional regulator